MADVKFKFTADDSEVRKKLNNLLKMREALSKGFDTNIDKDAAGGLAASLKDAVKQANSLHKALSKSSLNPANAELIASLVQKKKAIEDERLAQEKLRSEALRDSKAMRDAKEKEIESLKRAREERQKELKQQKELRDAAKSIKDAERAQRNIEKQEAKRQREAAKRKKQLEQESSEYYKLNKALGAVRKESKDLLAEMFRMERQGYQNTLGYQKLKEKADALTKQTQYLDRGIKKIDATLGLHQRNVGNYGEALELISPIISDINQKLALFGTSLDDLASKPGSIKQLGSAFVSMGKGILTFLVSPVGLLIAALGSLFMLFQRNKQTVIDFDNGLKNVSKTTGMMGKDLTAFGDAIVDLSMKLKVVDASKLLEYATAAGQLGVRGRADILAFTEAMAMLETASNISGEDGASEIARMLTLVDGGVQNVKAFGDEIVNLGNNFAATEKEILANAEQIAQNVGIYRIGRQYVLAFATATKAVGLEAELVGSTFSRTLGEFEKIVRSGKGVADLLKIVGGNQQELQRRFKTDAAGVFVDYVKGLNNIHRAGGSVNEALERTGVVAVRDQRVLASLATNGYGVLVDALEKVRNANGAMQQEFENGASKLQNQTRRMGIAWDNFVLSIENGEGVIGRSVVAIVGFFAELLNQINKTFNPTSVEEFIARLHNFKAADQIRDINKAMEEGEVQIKKLSSFDASKASTIELNSMLKETTSSIKIVSDALASYKKQVNEGLLTEKGKNSLKDFEQTINFLRIQESNLMRLGATTNVAKAPVFGESDGERATRERVQRDTERAAERRRQALERQRSLQQEIDSLNSQAFRNQLSRDEQEVASVRDKYAKIRQEVDKFYRDPKNKGFRVNTGGLKQAEEFEISEVNTRQGTTKLLEQLNQQKAIYDEYNNYVASNSLEEANRMYADQIEIVKDFKENLKKEYLDIVALEQTAFDESFSGSSVKLTQAQQERAKMLKDMIDSIDRDEQARQRSQYAELLKQYETYAQKRAQLTKKYQSDISNLERKGEKERANRAKELYAEEVKQLFQDEVESSGRFKKLMEDIDKSSQWLLSSAFKRGKEAVMSLIDGMYDATPEQRAELKNLYGEWFDRGDMEASIGNYEAVTNLIGGFDQLVGMATQFDGSMSSSLRTIGQMVGQVSSMASSIGKMMGSAGSSMSKAGMVGGIIGSIFSLFGSIIQIGEAKAARAREEQQRQDQLQIKQIEAVTKSLEYQLSLVQQIYGTDRIEAYAKAVRDAASAANDSIANLPGSQILLTGDASRDLEASVFNQYGGDIAAMQKRVDDLKRQMRKTSWNPFQNRKNRERGIEVEILQNAINYLQNGGAQEYKFAWKSIEDITQDEVTEMRKLIEEGKFDEVTAAQLSNVIEQWELWKDAMNQMREELTGISFKSLTDGIVSLFEQGKTSVEDFTDFFEKQMQQAILRGFSRDAIEKQMQPWYELFAQYSENGLTQDEVSKLRDQYLAIMGNAEKQWEDLKKVTGIDFSDSGTSSIQSESIARQLTEQTGTEIVGMFRAGYDIWKQQLNVMNAQSATQMSLLTVANNKLLVLNAIQVNTANTVARLDTAVKHLQNIDKNLGGKYAS
ncbi:phage tail tape measure protein [Sphingobacterium suaedae]|uniref:Phage tail tape measure protein n=2 Tax=Sphingobacterium suaedae TaxID=1686402 RepID=A0ABW5KII8_9SPHI